MINIKHGESKTKEYKTWASMRNRCKTSNAKKHKYQYYAGKGIKVCERWQDSYLAFLSDMGRSPSPKHSIERLDNAGDYEPSNCKWATGLEQSNNKRNNRFIEYNNVSKTLSQWSRELGLNRSLIKARLRYGWSVNEAFSINKRKRLV